VTRVVVLS